MKFKKNSEDIDEDEDEFQSQEASEKGTVALNTHERINSELCGEIQKLEAGYVELKLVTIPEMVVDSHGLIHSGFIFGAADYSAMVAVNDKNVVLVASDCQFLSPVKMGNIVDFIAKVRHKEGRKRNVHVVGFVYDIKVFEGEFKTVITERHVLKLKLLDDNEAL